MKISVCCISDIHGQLIDDLPTADLLVIAGDLCPLTNHNIYFQRAWLEETFNDWLGTLKQFQKIVFVAGNHDFAYQECSPKPKVPNGIYLQNNDREILDFKIWGSPYQNFFYDWAFNAYEPELEKIYSEIPNDTDIIVSHGPAFGYGDLTNKHNRTGSTSLTQRIKEVKPKLAVFGHIHSSYGIYTLDKTIIVSASVVNEAYKLVNKPIVVEVEK